MSSQLLRVALQGATKVPQRALSVSSVCSRNVVLDQKLRDEIYPNIGNREVVGFGINGQASYIDRCDFPCPAIRFKEDTPEILQLREKEKGDWKSLSLADKKALYRASFGQTFSEINAPTGDWKVIVATILFTFSATGWLLMYVKKYVLPPPVHTLTREWQEKSLQRMLDQGQGIVTGLSSRYDYENKRWKD